MNTKIVLGMFVMVLLLIGAYIASFTYQANPAPNEVLLMPPVVVAEDVTQIGEVIEVNFEKVAMDGPSLLTLKAAGMEVLYTIAVPSMGLPSCVASSSIADPFQLAPGDRLEVRGIKNDVGEIVPCSSKGHYLRASRTEAKSTLGFQFTYRKGPDGYVLEENTRKAADVTLELLYSAVFTNTAEYALYINATDVRESPEHYSIRVYENEEKLSIAQWAAVHDAESHVTAAIAEPIDATIGGKTAVRYTVDGLYPIDTYIVAEGPYMYLMTGVFNDQNSMIANDFAAFVDGLKFIPVVSEFAPR